MAIIRWRRRNTGHGDLEIDDLTTCPPGWEDIYTGRSPVEQALVVAIAATQEVMEFTIPRPGPNARAHSERVLLMHRAGLAMPGQDPGGGLLQAIYEYLVTHIGDGEPRRVNLATEGVELARQLISQSDDYRPMIPAHFLLLTEALAEVGRYKDARRMIEPAVADLTTLRRRYPGRMPAAIVAAIRAQRRLAVLK
jgi:hypothetical protein